MSFLKESLERAVDTVRRRSRSKIEHEANGHSNVSLVSQLVKFEGSELVMCVCMHVCSLVSHARPLFFRIEVWCSSYT